MKDLREEVGTKACRPYIWAGRIVRMKKREITENIRDKDARRLQKTRKTTRLEDCVKRDLRKAEEEEKRREKVNNRDQWKRITKVARGRTSYNCSRLPSTASELFVWLRGN